LKSIRGIQKDIEVSRPVLSSPHLIEERAIFTDTNRLLLVYKSFEVKNE